ncbi:hypothetical protein [Actinocorallia sp. A-T 12471]|uniref:hypothetical protein n=1 Tax=Actinocorallia sp. A-T 12471 TaxID=3089813 RepID=UPI0029D1A169|nr:hypothetical protein [Actinocorallia sp. A-T 12471]MDX6744056.1 hypothetical protein [Actinocorallia sp. A-T 12471]
MPAIEDCLTAVMAIPGARSVGLVDFASGLVIAAEGRADGEAAEHAAGAAELVRAVVASPVFSSAGTGDEIEEITVSGTAGHHLLALVTTETDTRLCLHLALAADRGNIALARHRMRDVLRDLAAG